MKTLKTLSAAAAFASAAFLSPASQAAGVPVLTQNFNNVNSLNDWVQVNNSSMPGSGWFQGNADIFRSESGTLASYVATNYMGAVNGMGFVDNWLITPELTLSGSTIVSFFTRAAADPGFADKLEVRFSSGSGTGTDGFTTLLGTLGPSGYPQAWEQFSTSLDFTGSGRFAFRYYGDAESLNYIGIDTLRITTAVPEPSVYLTLTLGLGLLGLMRRKLTK